MKSGNTYWNCLWVSVVVSVVVTEAARSYPGYTTSSNCESGGREGEASSPYRHYASITAYDTTRGRDVHRENITGCDESLVYMLARHGTRYPGRKDIVAMQQFLPHIRDFIMKNPHNGTLCPDDRARIRSWRMRMRPENDQKLGERGQRELFDIAQRYRRRFPDLLQGRHSNHSNFRFKCTSKSRTLHSAKAFASGLFLEEGMDQDQLDKVVKSIKYDMDDRLLRFYDFCPKWDETIGNIYSKEQNNFKNGIEIKEVLRDVKNKMGWPYNLKLKQLENIYDACRFEYALFRSAPFCALFSEENLKVMEYYEDLKYYWRDGYPYSLNGDMTCSLLQDIMAQLREGVQRKNPARPLGHFRFSHTKSLTRLYSNLGFFKDEKHLLATEYPTQIERKWRVSIIDTLGTNLFFGLYSCKGKGHKLRIWTNEKSIEIPGCTKTADNSCDMSEIEKLWGDKADQCDFQRICNINGSGSSSISGSNYIILAYAMLLIHTMITS